jgi:hypothetical protein
MLEIFDEERAVLNQLIHPEYLSSVVKELQLSTPVIIDITRQLLHYRYIKAFDSDLKPRLGVDVDTILNTQFQLTAKGFEALELPH